MTAGTDKKPKLLLVEDHPDAVLLVGLALKRLGMEHILEVVSNGLEAIDYVERQGSFFERHYFPAPLLVLLDLKMPVMDGFEFLAWLRGQNAYKHIPVIVLTSSTYSPDVKRAYQLGANSFLVKPVELDEFIISMRQLLDFWLGKACQLPEMEAPARNAPTADGRHEAEEGTGRAKGGYEVGRTDSEPRPIEGAKAPPGTVRRDGKTDPRG